MNKIAKFNIGDKVMLRSGLGPYTIRWAATFYKRVKYWLHEIGGVFDERQLSWHEDCTDENHGK